MAGSALLSSLKRVCCELSTLCALGVKPIHSIIHPTLSASQKTHGHTGNDNGRRKEKASEDGTGYWFGVETEETKWLREDLMRNTKTKLSLKSSL